jgi:iron complex outermembrane receptor protein
MAVPHARAPRRTRRRTGRRVAAVLLGALAWLAATPHPDARADAGATPGSDLLALPIEDLMQVQVVSVSPWPQSLADTPAATQVITAEDIRRSGARTVPELLRQVPGMDVARVNASAWAVSARGMTGRYATMLLVMVDGRTVYSPVFGGVFWEALAIPLDEIERIEVVRGPGGTLWGANAVNGVINIITYAAGAAGPEYSEAGSGGRERVYAHTRRDVGLGQDGHLRLSAQAFDREGFDDPAGGRAHDAWRETRGGFRWDGPRLGGDLSVQGGAYSGKDDFTAPEASLTPPAITATDGIAGMNGGHLMLNWHADHADRGWQVRAYLDRADRRHDLYGLRVLTEDVEVRHRRALGSHEVAWGVGTRRVSDRTSDSFTTGFDPARRTARWLSGFVEDEVPVGASWRLTYGTKLEDNSYTGLEVQPSARLAWHPRPDHMVWWAVSRAVRVPQRTWGDVRYVIDVEPGTPPTVTAVLGNPNLDATELLALEAGYRGSLARDLGLDLNLFANRYDHLNDLRLGTPGLEATPAPPHILVPLVVGQGGEAEAFGAEATVRWPIGRRLRMTAGYAWLKVNVFPDPTAFDAGGVSEQEGGAPQQQLRLAARADLPGRVALDGAVQVVDQLVAFSIPAYVLLDLRLAWEALPGLTLSVVGQNLLESRHDEYALQGTAEVSASGVPRMVYARVTWAP